VRRILSKLLIIAGLLLIISPLLKNGYSLYMQKNLLQDIEQAKPCVNSSVVDPVLPAEPTPTAPQVPVQTAPKIKAVLVLNIPKLNLKAAVVQGVTSRDLSLGPGLYPDSSLPGIKGNVSIAGHRNVFGSWFRHLNKLVPGDKISITYHGTIYNYEVETVFVVAENDWTVVAPTPYKALTLTTCDPPGNVTQRLIVRAKQVE